MYNNYLHSTIDSGIGLIKLLDQSSNLETALDLDFLWSAKSFVIEGKHHVLSYDVGLVKEIAEQYPDHNIVFWSLYDNTDYTEYFQHRIVGESVISGDALFTINQLCETYKIEPSRISFISPGIYSNKNYPNFKFGTSNFHYISGRDENWENIEQSPEELLKSKDKLFNLLHLNWKPSRSLFMFLADKQIAKFQANNNINYWCNYNFSGGYRDFVTRQIVNEGHKFNNKLVQKSFNETELMKTYKMDDIGRDLAVAKRKMDGEEMYSTYINISISAEPDKKNIGIEEQVFKSAMYLSPSLQIGSQRQMRKFNAHYGLDIFEDLWDIGGGLSSFENKATSFERIEGAVQLVKQLTKNKKQVIAWFKEDRNISRLRQNRNRVTQLLRKYNEISTNENEALHFLEVLNEL